MNAKIKSIIPRLKKLFNNYVLVFPYKSKEYRKVFYKGTNNNMIKVIFKYDFDLKDWYTI